MTAPRITWIRAGDRYPDLKDDPDPFIVLDGEAEIGLVKWIETGCGPECTIVMDQNQP